MKLKLHSTYYIFCTNFKDITQCKDITQIWDQSGKIISNPAQINYVFYAIL